MPRPFPWLSRLTEIRAAVRGSVRSHYTRRELKTLFRGSESAAGRMLSLLATDPVGSQNAVSREALGRFLEQVAETEDVAGLCRRLREERETLSRVKARYLVSRDELEVPLASLPVGIRIEPGRLTIEAATVEELCSQLVLLSQGMTGDPVGFQKRLEIDTRKPVRSAEAEDALWIDGEIERMKTTRPAA